MLGVGWTEMLIIGVVALIVIGPKDLPVVMNRIGKFAGQVRRMGAEFQREINRTTGLDEVRNLRTSITAPLKKTAEEIRRDFNVMTSDGVKPSGVIKPADPQKESVADEIRAAAGMPASSPVSPAGSSESSAPDAAPTKTLVKAAKTPKQSEAADAAVAAEPVASVEPVQPIAAAPKPRSVRKVSKAAVGEPSAAPPEATLQALKPAPGEAEPS